MNGRARRAAYLNGLKNRRTFVRQLPPMEVEWPQDYKPLVGGLSPTVTLLMRATNEYFTAGAVWVRRANVWTCTEAAPILRWMKGMNRDQAKIELLRRGCTWEWIDPPA